MSEIKVFLKYISEGKGKLDFIDYLRAALVVLATVVIVRTAFFLVSNWLISAF